MVINKKMKYKKDKKDKSTCEEKKTQRKRIQLQKSVLNLIQK